jgi:hypothetical protein
MAQIKHTYLSRDGKEFATELEADGRDKFLDMQDSIEAYCAAANLHKAQAGLMRKHLPGYAAFVETGKIEAGMVEAGPVDVEA